MQIESLYPIGTLDFTWRGQALRAAWHEQPSEAEHGINGGLVLDLLWTRNPFGLTDVSEALIRFPLFAEELERKVQDILLARLEENETP